jgi:hypothetical protein
MVTIMAMSDYEKATGRSVPSSKTKKKATPARPKDVNKSVKVSQKTIDDVKKMGMAKALRLAGQNAGATQAGAVGEQQEAIRRLYGARRVNQAASSYNKANAPKKPTDSRFSTAAPKKASSGSYTTGSGVSKAKPSGTYQTGRGVVAKKAVAPKKATPPAKKSGTTDPFARFVFGVGRAAKEPFTSKKNK